MPHQFIVYMYTHNHQIKEKISTKIIIFFLNIGDLLYFKGVELSNSNFLQIYNMFLQNLGKFEFIKKKHNQIFQKNVYNK
jgi:hypothetical protein